MKYLLKYLNVYQTIILAIFGEPGLMLWPILKVQKDWLNPTMNRLWHY